MKKCPYCAEDIQDAAIKCKHCGEFLNGAVRPPPPPPLSAAEAADKKLPRYFQKDFIILSFLCVGPFALPLLWWHPKMSRAWKLGLTIGILILSAILTYFMVTTLKSIYAPLDEVWNSR